MKGRYDAIVIGCSSGGLEALGRILPSLPPDFPLPLIVVMHMPQEDKSLLPEILGKKCRMPVVEATDKGNIAPGAIYIAPPGYHLLVEGDETFSLSVDPKVNMSRPSVDVLFETAADTYGDRLVALVLTGANRDGSHGIIAVGAAGGLCMAQQPETAAASEMPAAAIATGKVNVVLALDEIAEFLVSLEIT
ncbi:MAG: chemotaxis protein CheB [Sulfuricellaceae bacterium]